MRTERAHDVYDDDARSAVAAGRDSEQCFASADGLADQLHPKRLGYHLHRMLRRRVAGTVRVDLKGGD